MIGFHPIIIFVTNQIAILFQFWVHTEYIKKLHPAIEYLIATPSNHRVHHGSQEKYINKNYGATFIIWDRIFGTYQREEEQPVYGLTTNISHKANPLHINFHEFIEIFKDVRQAKGLKETFFYIFGDPGDVANYKKARASSGTIDTKNVNKPIDILPSNHPQVKMDVIMAKDQKLADATTRE